MNEDDGILIDVDTQAKYYDRASRTNRAAFLLSESVKLLAAAATPVLALAEAPKLATAIVAAGVVVIEGLQQLCQFRERWVSYRTTRETIRNERLLYRYGAGPYANSNAAAPLLAERMSRILATEQRMWESMIKLEQLPKSVDG